MGFRKDQKIVITVYDERSPQGYLHLYGRVLAVGKDNGRYFVCTKDAVIEDILFECELTDAENFALLDSEEFQINWAAVDLMPKTQSVNDALELYLKRTGQKWPSHSTRHKEARSAQDRQPMEVQKDTGIDSAEQPATQAKKDIETASDGSTRPNNTTGLHDHVEGKKNARTASDASIDSIDYYPTPPPPEDAWMEKAKRDGQLCDLIPGLQYALRHKFPSITRISLYDEVEAVYHRMRLNRVIPLYPTRYKETVFYRNFCIRNRRQGDQTETAETVFEPSSEEEHEKEKARRIGKRQRRDTILAMRKELDEHEAVMYPNYGDRRLSKSPYGYYDISKTLILECLTDPSVSSVYPQMFKRAYDLGNEKQFASFRNWALEVVVPMVILDWLREDLFEIHDTSLLLKILFSRRTKEFSTLVSSASRAIKRLQKVGLHELARQADDEVLEELTAAVVDGKTGFRLDGNPRDKLKTYTK